ncbi:MAG: two-component system phosphate regulon sensor histidine kinase PhoR [Kiritimatiellia bacterium]|jgi:two-component system phosphate regulon sensor histidine kinase PhoR
MKLRHKIFLMLVGGVGGLIALLYGVIHHKVHARFAALESQTAEAHMHRLGRALASRTSRLNVILTEWSAWDETRDYILGTNPEYVETQGVATFLQTQQLDLLVFYDQRKEPVASFYKEPDATQPVALPPEFLSQLSGLRSLFDHADTRSSAGGMIKLGNTVYEIVAQPISNNERAGAMYGTMILGQQVSQETLDELSDFTQLSVMAWPLDEQDLSPLAEQALQIFNTQPAGQISLHEADSYTLCGFRLVRELTGRPAMMLQVDIPRRMMQEANHLLQFMFWAMVLMGIIAPTLIYLGFYHQVLSRMLNLTRQVQALGMSELLNVKTITMGGQDELHELASSLDSALQQAAYIGKDFAQTIYYSPDMIATIGFDGIFQRINSSLEKALGYSLAGLQKKHFEGFLNPEDLPCNWKYIIEQDIDAEVIPYEGRFTTASGDERWIKWHLRPLQAEKVVLAVGRDITEERETSTALEKNEVYLNRIFEHTNEAIFIADVQTRQVVMCNQAASDMLGYDRDALMSRRVQDFHNPENYKKVKKFFAQLLREGTGYRDDIQFITRDGRILDTEISVSRIDTDRGPQLVSVIRDVSSRLAQERQQARTQLLLNKIREAQTEYIQDIEGSELFRLMITDLIQLTNSDCGWFGEIVKVNKVKSFLNIRAVGRSKDERGIERFIPYQAQLTEVEILDSLLGKVTHTGMAEAARHPKSKASIYGLPDSFDPLTSFLCLPLLQGGTTIGLIGLANRPGGYTKEDIDFLEPYLRSCTSIIQAYRQEAKRKEAEEALVREKMQRDSILHGIGDGVVVIDQKNRILLANHAARDLLALPAVVDTGKDWHLAVNQLTSTSNQAELLRDPQLYAQLKIQVDAPSHRVLKMVCTPFRDEHRRPIGRILLFSDITRETEIDRMKTEFVSSVSHELRTPLACIKGFTSTILSDDDMDTETRREFLQIIDRESDRLTALIIDILDLAKMEAGRMDWDIKELSLPAVIHEMVQVFQPEFESKNITLTYRGPAECTIQADHLKLTQLLQNLIGNGLKYSEVGQVTIELDARSKNLTISDTGLGIPEADLPYIFDRFYQVQRPGSIAPGAGLGLTLVKAVADGHGWSIDVASKPGKGTSFFIGLSAMTGPLVTPWTEEINA